VNIVIIDPTHPNMVEHVSSMIAHANTIIIEENTLRDGFIPLAKVTYGCVHFCRNSFLTSFVQAIIAYH
jgi:hypothetical protein